MLDAKTFKHNSPVYLPGDNIKGAVKVSPIQGKKFDHQGMQIEFIGKISKFHLANKLNPSEDSTFISSTRKLENATSHPSQVLVPFEFNSVEKPYETYKGELFSVTYTLKLTVIRNFASNIVKEEEVLVVVPVQEPKINSTVKMEFGLEDAVHVEFEMNKYKFHLKDCIIGKVYFHLLRVRSTTMSISIDKKETLGSVVDTKVMGEFEIMEGCSIRGETIPFRVFLSNYELSPSYARIGQTMSVKYFLNLSLEDDENRKFSKQIEIVLWRENLN